MSVAGPILTTRNKTRKDRTYTPSYTLEQGPQLLGHGLVLVCGLLGTGLHSRW